MAGHDCDVIVIGAGHNALASAAYLARAGLSVTVLEKRDRIGGGTQTEELTLPGFLHDTFSTGHPFLTSNPLFSADELGIIRNGLSYVGNDPVLVVPFPDGESLTLWCDPGRTAAEFARYSARDGAAWLAFLEEWKGMRGEHFARLTNAPRDIAAHIGSAHEARYLALRDRSGIDVVCDMFESDHVRAAMLWFGMVMVQPIDRPGTGIMPLAVPAEWVRGWINPIGGSVRLAAALADTVRESGGAIVLGAEVEKIIVEDGRAGGVLTRDGAVYRARRAIVSSMHFTTLPEKLPGVLPAPFVERTATWRAGPSLLVVHLAVNGNIQCALADWTARRRVGGPVDGRLRRPQSRRYRRGAAHHRHALDLFRLLDLDRSDARARRQGRGQGDRHGPLCARWRPGELGGGQGGPRRSASAGILETRCRLSSPATSLPVASSRHSISNGQIQASSAAVRRAATFCPTRWVPIAL